MLTSVNIDKIAQTPAESNCYTSSLSWQKEDIANTRLIALLSNIFVSCLWDDVRSMHPYKATVSNVPASGKHATIIVTTPRLFETSEGMDCMICMRTYVPLSRAMI